MLRVELIDVKQSKKSLKFVNWIDIKELSVKLNAETDIKWNGNVKMIEQEKCLNLKEEKGFDFRSSL